MIIVIADVDEVAALLGVTVQRDPEIVRPQESGPCVHCEDGAPYRCTYPYDDGRCPHLDNPEILCPIHDACEAMYCVMRARDECEAEQEEQVSSLCGYYDERSEHVDNIDPCTHPDACKTGCPYLDDDGIYCPVKDEWLAESEGIDPDVAWAWGDDLPEFVDLAQDPDGLGRSMAAEAETPAPLREACEAEQGHRDADAATREPVYETATPEWVEPEPDDGALHTYTVPATRKPHPNAWSDEEIEVIRRAQSAVEADRLYVDAFPESNRTAAAVSSRWYKLRDAGELAAPAPTPDFAGDTVPVTQCDEAAIRRPRFKAGDRVRISHPAFRGYTGTIRRYYAATENYLTHIDGTTDTMWLSEEYLEAA